MDVFDKLALLEMHMQRAVSTGAVTARELYERVQVRPRVRLAASVRTRP